MRDAVESTSTLPAEIFPLIFTSVFELIFALDSFSDASAIDNFASTISLWAVDVSFISISIAFAISLFPARLIDDLPPTFEFKLSVLTFTAPIVLLVEPVVAVLFKLDASFRLFALIFLALTFTVEFAFTVAVCVVSDTVTNPAWAALEKTVAVTAPAKVLLSALTPDRTCMSPALEIVKSEPFIDASKLAEVSDFCSLTPIPIAVNEPRYIVDVVLMPFVAAITFKLLFNAMSPEALIIAFVIAFDTAEFIRTPTEIPLAW